MEKTRDCLCTQKYLNWVLKDLVLEDSLEIKNNNNEQFEILQVAHMHLPEKNMHNFWIQDKNKIKNNYFKSQIL